MGASVDDFRTPQRQSKAVQTGTRYAATPVCNGQHAAASKALDLLSDPGCSAAAALRNGTSS
jgi:hypothetical protein